MVLEACANRAIRTHGPWGLCKPRNAHKTVLGACASRAIRNILKLVENVAVTPSWYGIIEGTCYGQARRNMLDHVNSKSYKCRRCSGVHTRSDRDLHASCLSSVLTLSRRYSKAKSSIWYTLLNTWTQARHIDSSILREKGQYNRRFIVYITGMLPWQSVSKKR